MKIKKGQLIEIDVTDIAFGGKGFAKVNGFAVFIDQAVAGDRVIARIVKKKKNHAEARIVELLTPSPMRIKPPCRYSGFCGGCKWQFINYSDQLVYKQKHVLECLEHIALLSDVTVHPTLASPRQFGYRNKMEFTFSDRRWLLPEEMEQSEMDTGFALGLHVPGTFWKVLDTSACLLQPETGNAILSNIRQMVRNSNVPVYGLRSHEGLWRFVMLRHSVAENRWMVNIITSAEDQELLQPIAKQLMEIHPEISSVVNNITTRKAGIAVGEYEKLLAGSPVIHDMIGPYRFEISANSFFQTNTAGVQQLYEVVTEYGRFSGNDTVLDLYTGIGTIAIFISQAVKSVTGFEITESAIADAEKNCRINGITNCRFISGDIRKNLPHFSKAADILIIDPPRAGMHKDVVKAVVNISPKRIVYVSCNPATLARDLAMLKDHYRICEVQPVDMFPHTFHVESVARLEKRQ